MPIMTPPLPPFPVPSTACRCPYPHPIPFPWNGYPPGSPIVRGVAAGPAPLSPGDFTAPGAMPGNAVAPHPEPASNASAVLTRGLEIIKKIRNDLKDPDPAKKSRAMDSLTAIIGYLSGYFAAGQSTAAPSLSAVGYGVSLQGQPSIDDALQMLQSGIESYLQAGQTRLTPFGLGVMALGAVIYGIGAYLCST